MIFARSVALVVMLLMPLGSAFAEGGTLFMRPDRLSYSVGDGLVVELYVNTGGVEVQAVEASLTFDPAGIEVERIDTKNSILTTWPTEPAFSNTAGTITFSGWTDGKYAGKDGYLATVYFRTPRNTPGKLMYESGAILAADGVGSNIIAAMRSGVYTVGPKSDSAPEVGDSSVPTADESATEEVDPAPIVSEDVPMKPTIAQYSKSLLAGERIEVRGTTSPNSKVLVYIAYADSEPTQSTISSETDGAFTFTAPAGTESGVYRVWAVQEDGNGVKSEPTDKIAITVRPSMAAAVGSAVVSVGTLILPFLGLVILVGLSLGYYFFKRSRLIA